MLSIETIVVLAHAAAWAVAGLMAFLFVVYDFKRRTPERGMTPEEAEELAKLEAAIEAARGRLS